MINILISIGIFIFSIYPTMAKIQLFDASLVKPDSLEVLKNAQTSASTLKKLLDKGQSEEFFKEAAMELERIRKSTGENEFPSEEIPWILYFIANTPLLTIDSADQARRTINSRDADLYLKEEALEMLAISTYRDLFPDDKASRESMASYGAAIMRDFLNGTKSKSYSDEPVFVSDKEAKATLKKNIEIMENAFSKIAQIQKKEQDRKQKKR